MDSRIDSHKLMLHPQRVAKWLNGEKILPINMEICLTGACNHRCTFCCCDYMGYKPDTLDYDILINNIKEISAPDEGLKSVLLAGTGEPCLYPRFSDVVNSIKRCGVDVALSTNGVFYTKDKIEETLASISWMRFSTSGGTEDTYYKIHRGKPGDLNRVFDNIAYAVEFKAKNKLKTVINVQIVMIPENVDEIVDFGRRVKELGVDIYIVKAFGWNSGMENKVGDNINRGFYDKHKYIKEQLDEMSDCSFTALYRSTRIDSVFGEKGYEECYASPFHAFIAANGSVYPCCNLPGIEQYEFGNINRENLKEIFFDEKGRRVEVLKNLKRAHLSPCASGCKLELMNKYLNDIIHPSDHINFI